MILVIDNHDSFTYNLVQLVASLGAAVAVHRSDEITAGEIEALAPAGIILSPGPGGPVDAGICLDVVRRFGPTVPILGVCLGHQVIGAAYGAVVRRARLPVHGKASPIAHTGDGVFRGLPDPVAMIRYHSLVLAPESVPTELEVTAWTAEPGREREIQGVAHRSHPVWGVQFHPESAGSSCGDRLVANYLERTG
jgi:anthranilate synthase component II